MNEDTEKNYSTADALPASGSLDHSLSICALYLRPTLAEDSIAEPRWIMSEPYFNRLVDLPGFFLVALIEQRHLRLTVAG